MAEAGGLDRDAGVTLVALGVGDAFSARHYSACVAVGVGDAWLLVDCPHPIRKILRESGSAAGVDLDVGNLLAVAVTHLHADHSSGLEGLGYYARFVVGRRARLVAHPAVLADLWPHHLEAGMSRLMDQETGAPRAMTLDDYFEVTPLSEDTPVEMGPFVIECRRTIHPIPTTALRIRAGGRTLALSADTTFDPALVAWLGEADLVLHETGHGIHTPYERLAALPGDVRARIRLVHYADDFDVEGSVIEPLRQGRRYTV